MNDVRLGIREFGDEKAKSNFAHWTFEEGELVSQRGNDDNDDLVREGKKVMKRRLTDGKKLSRFSKRCVAAAKRHNEEKGNEGNKANK